MLVDDTGLPILAGFLLIFVMERFVFVHACEERECDIHQMGIPAFLGISLHSLLDGIALGAGLMLPQLGPVVLLAVLIHKMPDSISISSILLSAGWERRKVATLSLLFSLTTPVGALLAFLFLRELSENTYSRRPRSVGRHLPGDRDSGYFAASSPHPRAQSPDLAIFSPRPRRELDRQGVGPLIAALRRVRVGSCRTLERSRTHQCFWMKSYEEGREGFRSSKRGIAVTA